MVCLEEVSVLPSDDESSDLYFRPYEEELPRMTDSGECLLALVKTLGGIRALEIGVACSGFQNVNRRFAKGLGEAIARLAIVGALQHLSVVSLPDDSWAGLRCAISRVHKSDLKLCSIKGVLANGWLNGGVERGDPHVVLASLLSARGVILKDACE